MEGTIIMSDSKKKSKPSKKLGARRKARELCVQALYQFEKGSTEEHLRSLQWIAGNNLPNQRTVSYFLELFEGSLKNLEEIDKVVQSFTVKYDYNKIMSIDKAILRFGTYALLYEMSVPTPIIINEAVEIAKDFSGNDAHKFINGVLDGVRKKLVEEGQRAE